MLDVPGPVRAEVIVPQTVVLGIDDWSTSHRQRAADQIRSSQHQQHQRLATELRQVHPALQSEAELHSQHRRNRHEKRQGSVR